MTTCAICTAKTADVYLCTPHIGELRATLHALAHGELVNGKPTAGLLECLADVVLRQTRLGLGGGHRKRGDEISSPFEPDTERGRLTRQGEASLLADIAANTLGTIVRALCEDRGADVPTLDTPGMAVWLADNVRTVALGEDAGQTWTEVDSLRRRIERLIDRPVRFETLGFCQTDLDDGECGTVLRAREGAIEVRCRKCHTVRRCDMVIRMSQSRARRELITWTQVLQTNKLQAEDQRLSDRTLRDWKANGVIPVRGHYEGEDLYRWGDIEALRARGRLGRGERKRTRAGA